MCWPGWPTSPWPAPDHRSHPKLRKPPATGEVSVTGNVTNGSAGCSTIATVAYRVEVMAIEHRSDIYRARQF